MSFAGKFLTKQLKSVTLGGEILAAAIAGTTGNVQVLMRDGSKDILYASGTDVPTDATSGYAKGCTFIDRDVATGSTGVYENIGTNTSCVFEAVGGSSFDATTEEINLTCDGNTATAAEITLTCDGNTATAAEITQGCDLSVQESMAPAAGFLGTGTVYDSAAVQHGSIIKTDILIDLTGAKSSTTDLDIIGYSGASYIGQVTDAINGTITGGRLTCIEAPAGGVTDIDLYEATEDTGAFDAGIGTLTETALITAGGAWTAGLQKTFAEVTDDAYLYLTCGAGGTAATYTAGKFLLELWGL